MKTTWQKLDLGPGVEMWCAADGCPGDGRIVFDNGSIRVTPSGQLPLRGLKGQMGNAKIRPQAGDGSWSLVFLFCRAEALSSAELEAALDTLRPTTREAPKDAEDEAAEHLARGAKIRLQATEARASALIGATSAERDLEIRIGLSATRFLRWCQLARLLIRDRLIREEVDFFTGRSEGSLQYDSDVRFFMTALRTAAVTAGCPPAKADVRAELGKLLLAREWDLAGQPTPIPLKEVSDRDAAEHVDKQKWQGLLKRTGFQWLPTKEPGRPPKS